MANEILPNFGIELPDVAADQDNWGEILNNGLRLVDTKAFNRVTGGTVSGATVFTAAVTVLTPTIAGHAATKGYVDAFFIAATDAASASAAQSAASASAAAASATSAANSATASAASATASAASAASAKASADSASTSAASAAANAALLGGVVAAQYVSFVPYLPNDSIQNYITRLLVRTGLIPQISNTIGSNFTTQTYNLGL